ncbi:MAG: hypothetical protein M1562_01340 [Candidatus Marsarchaeota archaeon]|nr:hypothetical protein [Candidatus Marsarchaeota archaeon]
MERVFIPKARIMKLFGKRDLLEQLEHYSDCKLVLNKDENYIDLIGKDALSEYIAKDIVFAYGRGFDASVAAKLRDDEYYLKVIDIRDYTRNSGRIKRIKSRLIGARGRARLNIEEMSSGYISIYGDTVSIIGTTEQIKSAQIAAETIIKGGSHKLAYKRMASLKEKGTE